MPIHKMQKARKTRVTVSLETLRLAKYLLERVMTVAEISCIVRMSYDASRKL